MSGSVAEGPPTQAVLYDYWRSSASYRLRIGLRLKGIESTSLDVDLRTGAHRNTDHIERNPQGFVPVLVIDGQRFTQSLAALEYLDETRPGMPLLPSAPADRARIRTIAYAIAMDIHPICNLHVVNHLQTVCDGDGATRIAWMQHFMRRGLDAVEALLDDPRSGRSCNADTPGLADCCLVPQVYNAERWELDVAAWPNIRRINEYCKGLPDFAAAHPDSVKTA